MPNYTNSKIYVICCNITGETYYGSTTSSLGDRLSRHKYCHKLYKIGEYPYVSAFDILDRGDYVINLVEQYPCKSKRELEMRERYHITNNKCINKNIPTRAKKEYYKDNQQQILQKKRDRYKQDPDKFRQSCRESYVRHSEKRKQEMQKWRNDNQQKHRQNARDWYKNNKDRVLARQKEEVLCVCGEYLQRRYLTKHRKRNGCPT